MTTSLEDISLFQGIPAEVLAVLRKNMRPLHIEGGQALVTEGVTTRGPLFIVLDGNVEVTKKDAKGVDRTLTIIEPPTVIGEMEFLVDIKSSASVIAHDDVTGFLLPRARFEALFDEGDPAAYHLALQIGKIVSVRLAETNILLSKALAKDGDKLHKVQKAQAKVNIDTIDAELDDLLNI